MTRTSNRMRTIMTAGMISIFALSLAGGPALARGGAGDGRNDPFVESFKAKTSYQERQAKKKETQAKRHQGASKPRGSAEEPGFFERLFGADSKDGD